MGKGLFGAAYENFLFLISVFYFSAIYFFNFLQPVYILLLLPVAASPLLTQVVNSKSRKLKLAKRDLEKGFFYLLMVAFLVSYALYFAQGTVLVIAATPEVDAKPTGGVYTSKDYSTTNANFGVTVYGNDDKQVTWLLLTGPGISSSDQWYSCSTTSCSNTWTVSSSTEGSKEYAAWVYDKNGGVFVGSDSIIVDGTKPSSTISSPASGKSFAADFSVTASSTDSGGSGLKACYYSVYDAVRGYNTVTKKSRPCTGDFTVTVGSGKNCEASASNSCQVSVFAEDNAGNLETTAQNSYRACYGSIVVSTDKTAISYGQPLKASVAVPSCTSGKTIEYKICDVLPLSNPQACTAVKSYSCTSTGSSGCDWNVDTSFLFDGTYTIFAWVADVESFAVNSTSFKVSECISTRPKNQFPILLGNGCFVDVQAMAIDSSTQTEGKYKNPQDGFSPITAEYDDAKAGDCDPDLRFNVAWSGGPDGISITAEKEWKKGKPFGCFWCSEPGPFEYGYTATSSNCKFLAIDGACLSSGTCPLPKTPPGSDTLTFLQPDSYSFVTNDFRVGECLKDSDCNFDLGRTKCNTNTNMCESSCGTCSAPKSLGSLNNNGDSLSSTTCPISSSAQDDVFKFNVNKVGTVTASVTSTSAQIGIDGILGPVSGTTNYCSASIPFKCNTDGATSSSKPTVSCSFFASQTGEYSFDATWWSGSGTATVTVTLEGECTANSQCSGSKPYCDTANKKCVECFVDTDCKGPDKTYNTYCPKATVLQAGHKPSNIRPTCDTSNQCQCESTCGTGSGRNARCAPDFCCTGEKPTGPGESSGQCVPVSTVKNPWLCKTS